MPSPQTRAAPEYQRNALAPAILAAIACVAGIALLSHEYYLAIRFIVAILAVIIGWFALQARQWWWMPVMLAIAIVWNPLYPFEFAGPWWVAAHVIAAAVFLAAGALIRSPRTLA
ncbi:hypothetical protein NQ156_12305 [Microbacterium sp. zg.Y625]|uniref:DUF6804 family protein n=1 Tax=Microbacterium jiangjiandongii TaxID=3049071 RepID=UPI00214BD3A8|nr:MULTISPECIES: DUF6804 family protein [unclassified Microbacterium]MCR2793847.1 hypothetical protein [Microbacterium sp. zg.Y625]MCR2816073.1 hypothetical protein [Microbacterium sp. zg.Y843]WIM26186.1 hypothetical protein QNO14_03785 [Microbacterium sp. zg-Y625]